MILLVFIFIWKEVFIVNYVWIMWLVNELVLVNCILIMLFMIVVFFCDFGLWFGFGFLGGSYGFGICLLDWGNNVVGLFVYKWLNGEYWKKKIYI